VYSLLRGTITCLEFELCLRVRASKDLRVNLLTIKLFCIQFGLCLNFRLNCFFFQVTSDHLHFDDSNWAKFFNH